MLQNSPMAVQFVDKLIEEKGLHGLDEEVRLQLRADLLRRLDNQINRAIIQSLSQDQLVQFEHLIDTNKIDKIPEFLYKHGINVNGIVARTMADFHATYLET